MTIMPRYKEENCMKKAKAVKLLALLLAAVSLFALCACGAKGGKEQPTAQTTFEELGDYAKRLEKAGNYEAAQHVYELIPKAVSGAAIADIETEIADSAYGKYFADMQNLDKWADLIESAGVKK